MDNFLQTLWKNSKTNRQEELENIIRWCEDEETVSALVRFAYWDSVMRDAFPETMQDLYKKLEFDRDRQANVASPSAAADWGPTDWTFTVYVIRFYFLQLLSRSQKEAFKSRPLSIELLDEMETMMKKADDDMETMMNTAGVERTRSPFRSRGRTSAQRREGWTQVI